MKSDSELQTDVASELAWYLGVDATAIDVVAKGGLVTLTGHVATLMERHRVKCAVRRAYGVRAFDVRLDVKLAPRHRRSDDEILVAADGVLAWISGVPTQDIRVTVERGWIELSAEVDWDYQRRAIEVQLRPLIGVLGIRNGLMLRHILSPENLAQRIEQALQRQAQREARNISISVQDGTVTLRGFAHSWQERGAIVGAAWAAPGVRCVVDEVQFDSRIEP